MATKKKKKRAFRVRYVTEILGTKVPPIFTVAEELHEHTFEVEYCFQEFRFSGNGPNIPHAIDNLLDEMGKKMSTWTYQRWHQSNIDWFLRDLVRKGLLAVRTNGK